MLQKYQELKDNFDKVIELIDKYNASADKKDIENYLLSLTLRIWFCSQSANRHPRKVEL